MRWQALVHTPPTHNLTEFSLTKIATVLRFPTFPWECCSEINISFSKTHTQPIIDSDYKGRCVINKIASEVIWVISGVPGILVAFTPVVKSCMAQWEWGFHLTSAMWKNESQTLFFFRCHSKSLISVYSQGVKVTRDKMHHWNHYVVSSISFREVGSTVHQSTISVGAGFFVDNPALFFALRKNAFKPSLMSSFDELAVFLLRRTASATQKEVVETNGRAWNW